MENIFQVVIFCGLIACAWMEVVEYNKCNNHPNVNCTVSEVRVTPCAEAAEKKPCVIKRGKSAKIEFDFKPNGTYTNLETRAYWASSTGDLPWIGMDTNGCLYTKCPTSAMPESFSYNLYIDRKLPARQYDVKWRLWAEDAMECCFLIKIKLVK